MLLFNNSSIGGAERRYARVYQELRRRKISIALAINESLFVKLQRLGVFSDADRPALLVKDRFGKRSFGLRKMDYVLGWPPVALWLMRRRPTVLHLILGGAYLALPLQLIGAAPPAILSVVCPNLRDMVGSTPGLYLYRLALRWAACVDALTDSVRAMVECEGVAAERIRVPTGSCVDTQRFQPADKHPWVVFAGRLVPDKDPLLFVQACALVRERFKERKPGLRFFMLGDGPLRKDVDTLIKQQGLGGCMQVGWNEQVESILNQTTVFASLQQTDNYPSQALLEAMACGAAVVATDVGLTGKLVDDTVGRLVAAKPDAVADAIVELLDHPDAAAAMGRRARARVMQHHSMEAYLDYLEGLYAQTC